MLRKCFLVGLCLGLSSNVGFACATYKEMNLRDIFLADMIVLGDVWGYEVVGPSSGGGYPSDYARFKVRVHQVFFPNGAESVPPPTRSDLKGVGVNTRGWITVTWVNSTYGLPSELESKDHPGFLIALRYPAAEVPSKRPGNEFMDETPEPEHYTVLQRPCSSAFIFDGRGPISIALQQVLETDRDREVEFQVLEEFLFARRAMSKLEAEIYSLKNVGPIAPPPGDAANE